MIEATDVPTTTPELTRFDRCDACQVAAAQVRVTFPLRTQPGEGEFLFCGHHYAEHEVALYAHYGELMTVQDERARLVDDVAKAKSEGVS